MDVHQENQIIIRVQNGDVKGFEQLVRCYQGALFRIIGNLVHPVHQLEDLVQDIFLAAFANIRRFDPNKGSFRAWLYTIARNRATNVRRKHRECPLPEGLDPVHKRTPMDDLMVKEAFDHLDRAIDRLKFEDRMIFVLAELEGLPYADIAEIEKIPLGTVKSRLARVREKLHRALEHYRAQSKDSQPTMEN